MRLVLAAFSISIVASSSAMAANAGAAGRVSAAARNARARTANVSCAQSTQEPTGVCSPYDREHCRFEDGSLQNGDLRDPHGPFTLKPVAGKPGVYCRYDGELHLSDVVTVEDPETQKREWDAKKLRRHTH